MSRSTVDGSDSTETGAQPVDESFGTGGLRSLLDRAGWALVAEVANLVVTAVVFKILLDFLDPGEYGGLQAVIGIAAIIGPLSTFGANWLLIRRGVVSPDLRADLGRAVNIAAIGTLGVSAMVVAVLAALPGVLPELSRLTIAVILLAQVVAFWLLELGVTAAVTRADLRLSALCRITAAAFRLLALAAFALGSTHDLARWAWYFAAGNLAAAVAVHLLVARSLGGLPRLSRPARREFTSGFPYGLGNTTESVLAASDKPLMTQYAPRGDDGIYAAGYRIVSLGLLPTMALFKAQDRRFFRQGTLGSAAAHEAGRRMSVLTLPTTVPVAVVLFVAAPYLDLVISDSFEETESVIRFLALLPVIKGFQFSFGNSLTAAGNQKARMWLTGAAALGNVLGNLWLIPIWSWRAAATTTLVAEGALALAFVVASHTFARRHG